MPEPFRVLCYGDSNTWGAEPLTNARFAGRVRWTGVLQERLGRGFTVIEEGLNGRTTVRDDPYEPFRNGRSHLVPCLLSHQPLDLLIVMLGTNDLKSRFNVTAEDIGRGMALLLADARQVLGTETEILLVAPAPLGDRVDPPDMFGPGIDKSRQLAAVFRDVASAAGTRFFDAGSLISLNHGDGIHLAAEDHARLGAALADLVAGLAG